MKFLQDKKIINRATTGPFKNLFIAEDLSPFRSRLMWTIKQKFEENFVNVHTRNGTIRMKRDAKDENWLKINNTDDLFKHLNVAERELWDWDTFNKDLPFKISPLLPTPESFAPLADEATA